jgi:hypothetical protein
MHQTTVRFGPDLWEALERECKELGISVAQYVREAALTRLVYVGARRGDAEFELALDLVAGDAPLDMEALPGDPDLLAPRHRSAAGARTDAEQSAAMWAQARQAQRRAGELRDEIAARRQDHEARRRDADDGEDDAEAAED